MAAVQNSRKSLVVSFSTAYVRGSVLLLAAANSQYRVRQHHEN